MVGFGGDVFGLFTMERACVLYFSIPGIIGYFARVTASSKYLVYYLLAFAIAIYAAVDLCVRIKLSSFDEITSTEDDTTEN